MSNTRNYAVSLFWFVVALCALGADGASLKSASDYDTFVNGRTVRMTQLVISCSSNTRSTPLTMVLTRPDSIATDTVQFECQPPQIDYDVTLMGFIPEAVFVSVTPIVLTAVGINYTSAADIENYVQQQIIEQLARSGIEVDPLDNLNPSLQQVDDSESTVSSPRRRNRHWSLSDVPLKSPSRSKDPFYVAIRETNRKLIKLYEEIHGKPMPKSGGGWKKAKAEAMQSASTGGCSKSKRCLFQADITVPKPAPDFDFPVPEPPRGNIEVYSISEILKRQLIQDTFSGILFALASPKFKAGALVSMVNNLIFTASGQSGLALLAKTLVTFMDNVLAFQANVIGFQEATKNFNTGVLSELRLLSDITDLLAQNDVILRDSISLLQNKTDQMIKDQEIFRNSTMAQFVNVSRALTSLGTNTDNITRALLLLDDKGDYQFQLTVNAINNIRRYIEAVQNQVETVNTKLQSRRLVCLYYHETRKQLDLLADKIGTTSPFMHDAGRPPLTYAQMLELENVDGALVMASVEIQGSYTVAISSGSSIRNAFATSIKIDLLCSPMFVANITIADPSPDFVWDNIGPSTSAMPQCSGALGTARPWNCRCIFRATGKRLQYASSTPPAGQLFPWYLPATRAGLLFDQIPELSTGTLTGSTPVNIPTVYLNTMAEMELFLENAEICNPRSSTDTRDWIQQRVRLVNQLTLQYADIPLDDTRFPGGRAAMCNAYHVEVFSTQAARNATIASILYTYIRQEFATFLRVRSETANELLFGSPGNVKVESQPGSTHPTRFPAYEQLKVSFASLATDEYGQAKTLPVFKLDRSAIRYRMDMRYNGRPAVTHEASADGDVTEVPVEDRLLGNITVITNTALANIEDMSMFASSMPWVGHSVHNTDNPVYFEATEFGTDPTVPLLHVDFNKEDIELGNGPQEDKMTYIFNRKDYFDRLNIKEEFDLGNQMVMNMSTWMMQATPGSTFDPQRAINTAVLKLRRIDPNTAFCGQSYNVFEAALEPAFADNFMCSLRRVANIPTYWPIDTARVTMVPWDRYSFDMVVSIPRRAITTIVTTRCPSSYNITYFPSTRLAFLRLSSVEDIAAKFSICDETGGFCLNYGEVISFGPSSPFIRTVNLVGRQLFLQVWPMTDPAPTNATKCYGGSGVMLYINSSFSNSGPMTGNVLSQVREAMAPQIQVILNTQAVQSEISALLATILFSSQSGAALKAAILERLNAIGNVTRNFEESVFAENERLRQEFASSKAIYDLINGLLNNNTNRLTNNTESVFEKLELVRALFPYLEEQLFLQALFQNGSIESYLTFYNNVNKFRQDTILKLSDFDPRGLISRLGKSLGGIFSGGGFGLPDFFDIITIVFILVCICACCIFAPQLMAWIRRLKSGVGSDAVTLTQADSKLAEELAVVKLQQAKQGAQIDLMRTQLLKSGQLTPG